MSSRHLSRSIVLQILFDLDFNKEKVLDIEETAKYAIDNFGAGIDNTDFIKNLVQGIMSKKEELDEIIQKAAPEWPIDQIAVIDRNILRIGLYELLFEDRKEVPPKVAINEAIELAKSFGGEASGKFVNGVLGTVYKEIGEPGKDDVGYHKKDKDIEPATQENLAGAAVYKFDGDKLKFALVHDVFGYWTLPKGKLSEGENLKEGAVRSVKDELGVLINIKENLGANSYIAFDPQKGKTLKNVNYFLGETKDGNLDLKESGGLDDAKWFDANELPDLKIYNDIFPFLTKAIQILATSH